VKRVLIAGLGNIFLGDDGFGVEVAHRLLAQPVADGVTVRDIGIRGIHLAYELLDDYDLVILIDAVSRGGSPGSVYLIEHHEPAAADGSQSPPMIDAHDLKPDQVLATVAMLGGTLARTVVVGCEPEQTNAGMGLSDAVRRSVDDAAQLVLELIEGLHAETAGQRPERASVGGE
jgi:hydrogenase maturation protease